MDVLVAAFIKQAPGVSAKPGGEACQPEMILDGSKIKRPRLKRGIYEIDSKIVACLSQDCFVVCLMPVLAHKYGLY